MMVKTMSKVNAVSDVGESQIRKHTNINQ